MLVFKVLLHTISYSLNVPDLDTQVFPTGMNQNTQAHTNGQPVFSDPSPPSSTLLSGWTDRTEAKKNMRPRAKTENKIQASDS